MQASHRTELLDARRSALVVVDLQGKLMDMVYKPARVLAATQRLLKLAELYGVPVVLTEQYPRGLGVTQADVRAAFDALSVPKRFLEKVAFGCCGDAAFEPALAELLPGVPAERRQIVVCGIEAHVCVMQTALPLLAAGSAVHLCWEAVSARGKEYRKWGLQRMLLAGAVPTNHESVGFEWARDKDHPSFKAMSAMFKEGQLT